MCTLGVRFYELFLEMVTKSKLQLKIVSLKEVVFHDYVDSVTLPTKSGEITVLPHHVPLISHLEKGTVRAKSKSQQTPFDIEGGFMEVSGDSRVTVLLS